MSGVTRYNVRRNHTTREVSFRESRELANSKIAPTLCYEGGTPGYYIRQSILKTPSPLLQGLFHTLLRHHHLFRSVTCTCFLHVSRSTGAFAQAPFGRVRSPVVPRIGGAIWWVAEPQTVLFCCILQQYVCFGIDQLTELQIT
ncbi:hypothetical protein AVEN_96597-1 [Araneus ventricosus]|uniref:Uncharacterized protein n=1 Tax=Araneus ventricosus TaxID=182803 RepID=A0A4Y2KYF3_ARAVE|nr:hypothetical protein AVEN_96597-1 [Araneus ventricosus]